MIPSTLAEKAEILKESKEFYQNSLTENVLYIVSVIKRLYMFLSKNSLGKHVFIE